MIITMGGLLVFAMAQEVFRIHEMYFKDRIKTRRPAMKKMSMVRKLLSMVAVPALVLGMMPGMAMEAEAEHTYPLWIGDKEVTSSNSSGEGWSYDSSSNTLTLNGFNISVQNNEPTIVNGIKYTGDKPFTINPKIKSKVTLHN